MSTLREAAQKALDALEDMLGWESLAPQSVQDSSKQSLQRLREALAQPEPEPWQTRERFYEAMACAVENVRQEMKVKIVTMRCQDYDVALPILDAYSGHVLVGPVFVPPRRKPLTDEEVTALVLEWWCPTMVTAKDRKFVRAIERAHGIGSEE